MTTSKCLAAAALLFCAAAAGAVELNVLVPRGSTPEQVRSALGEPDSRVVQRLGKVDRVIWVYGTSRRRPRLTRGPKGTATPQGSPLFGVGKPYRAPPRPETYHERFYVIFRDGRVAGVTDAAP